MAHWPSLGASKKRDQLARVSPPETSIDEDKRRGAEVLAVLSAELLRYDGEERWSDESRDNEIIVLARLSVSFSSLLLICWLASSSDQRGDGADGQSRQQPPGRLTRRSSDNK